MDSTPTKKPNQPVPCRTGGSVGSQTVGADEGRGWTTDQLNGWCLPVHCLQRSPAGPFASPPLGPCHHPPTRQPPIPAPHLDGTGVGLLGRDGPEEGGGGQEEQGDDEVGYQALRVGGWVWVMR